MSLSPVPYLFPPCFFEEDFLRTSFSSLSPQTFFPPLIFGLLQSPPSPSSFYPNARWHFEVTPLTSLARATGWSLALESNCLSKGTPKASAFPVFQFPPRATSFQVCFSPTTRSHKSTTIVGVSTKSGCATSLSKTCTPFPLLKPTNFTRGRQIWNPFFDCDPLDSLYPLFLFFLLLISFLTRLPNPVVTRNTGFSPSHQDPKIH